MSSTGQAREQECMSDNCSESTSSRYHDYRRYTRSRLSVIAIVDDPSPSTSSTPRYSSKAPPLLVGIRRGRIKKTLPTMKTGVRAYLGYACHSVSTLRILSVGRYIICMGKSPPACSMQLYAETTFTLFSTSYLFIHARRNLGHSHPATHF
jgi:hypothetical protein